MGRFGHFLLLYVTLVLVENHVTVARSLPSQEWRPLASVNEILSMLITYGVIA